MEGQIEFYSFEKQKRYELRVLRFLVYRSRLFTEATNLLSGTLATLTVNLFKE